MFTDRDMLKIIERTAKALNKKPEDLVDVTLEILKQSEAPDLDHAVSS